MEDLPLLHKKSSGSTDVIYYTFKRNSQQQHKFLQKQKYVSMVACIPCFLSSFCYCILNLIAMLFISWCIISAICFDQLYKIHSIFHNDYCHIARHNNPSNFTYTDECSFFYSNRSYFENKFSNYFVPKNNWREVFIDSNPNVNISAFVLLQDSTANVTSHPWVLLLHDKFHCKYQFDVLLVAGILWHSKMVNILVLDVSNHGSSTNHLMGDYICWGYYEYNDITYALEFLQKNYSAPMHHIGIYGIGMGASISLISLHALHKLPNLQSISLYLDSLVCNADGTYRYLIDRTTFKGFSNVYVPFVCTMSPLLRSDSCGCANFPLNPLQTTHQFNSSSSSNLKVYLLFEHTLNDQDVPNWNAELCYNAWKLSGNVNLESYFSESGIAKDTSCSQHGVLKLVQMEKFSKRIIRFFTKEE